MKKSFGLNVRKKLLITYILIGVIPLLCLGFYAFSQYSGQVKDEIIKKLQLSSKDVVREIENKLDTYSSSMSRMIYDPKVNEIFDTADKKRQNDLISNYLLPHVGLVNSLDIALKDIVFYADVDNSSWLIQNISTIENTKMYKQTVNNNSSITVTDTQIVFSRLFRPVIKREQPIIISLYIDRDLFFYSLNTKKNDIGLVIKNENGRVINSKSIDEAFVLRKNPIPKLEFADNSLIYVNEAPYFYNTDKIDSNKWSVTCYMETNWYYQQENLIVLSILLITLSAVICFLSIAFSKKIVTPIHALNRRMKQVEHGDYNVQFENIGSDEIGQLEDNFNCMVKQIQKLIEFELVQEITIRDNELSTLYAQISPHFLYNTLHTINMKAVIFGAPEISFLVNSLASFYRTALNRGKTSISVSGELENLKAYFNIQSVMHDNSYVVDYQIDPKILNCKIPNFVLQPLAENAIEHGVDMIDTPGIILVSGEIKEGCIFLCVQDNGPGFNFSPKDEISKKGYGIYNVDARIKLMFGEKYGLRFISSQLGGACSQIYFPARPYEERQE